MHFHGDWFRTDTLHTLAQLRQDRPKLSASLAQLISARTLVVLGYSGWDDVFTRSLIATIRGGLAPLKVAWAFYSSDETKITKNSAGLLEALRPGIEHGRVVLYRGIDAHAFLPRLSAQLAEMAAAAVVESPRRRFGSAAHPAAGSGTHASDAAVVSPLDRVLPLPAALLLATDGPGDGSGEPGDGPTGERGAGPDPATGPSATSSWPPWALALLALGASGIALLTVLLIRAWRRPDERPDDASDVPEDAPPVPWDQFVARE